MELPDLGEHCSLSECRRLDYLPVKCTSCKQVFCGSHYRPTQHHCPTAQFEYVRLPICPLCDKSVPLKAGKSVDQVVDEHIWQNCVIPQQEKVFTNRCSASGCKKKELMQLLCGSCGRNHCLKHRHAKDHQCGQQPKSGSKRKQPEKRQVEQEKGTALQGNLTDEEALELAIQESLATREQKQKSKRFCKSM